MKLTGLARISAVASLCWLLTPATGWCDLFILNNVRSTGAGTFEADLVVNAPIDINALDAVFNDPTSPTFLQGLTPLSFTPAGAFIGHIFDLGGIITVPPDHPQFGFIQRQAVAANTKLFTWTFSSDGSVTPNDIKKMLTANVTPGVLPQQGETDPFSGNVPYLATTTVPEPGTVALLMAGLSALVLALCRRSIY